jgi:hypothetical protein
MPRYRIARLSVMPIAIIVGAVVTVIGIIPAVIGIIASLSYGPDAEQLVDSLPLLILPVAGGGVALLLTAAALAAYNQVADRFGGIEVELDFLDQEKSQQ